MFNHKILLLGSTGYVGSHFVKHLNEYGINFIAPSRYNLDAFDDEELIQYLLDNSITFLINCIGYTGKPNVDKCEDNKEECLRTNALLPIRISTACRAANVPWGHISSGCIYNYYHKEFTEEDEPNFTFGSRCSYYSGTKAIAEAFLKDDTTSYIWRLRIPFSNVDSDRNYISKILKCERVNWCKNSLTNIDEFCEACIYCIINCLPYGTYNLTNPGGITASEVLKIAKDIRKTNNVWYESSPDDLHPIVPRSNCILNVNKAAMAGIKMLPVKESIIESLKNWVSQ